MPEPTAATPTRLSSLADELLDALVDAADELGIELPQRKVVADGAVAWDCPLVAVALPTITRGVPGQELVARNLPSDSYVAEYGLWLLRPVPMPGDDGSPPPAAKVSASGHQLMDDGYLLTVGMRTRLRTIGQACTALAQGTTSAQGPEGGLAGWSSTVRVGV